jgi:uroporphyrinogen decarboxylase
MPGPFAGLTVAAFESRMAGPMAELIARQGGVPLVAPSLREVPLEANAPAVAFARGLLAGEFDAVVFLTGVGARYLAESIEAEVPRADWLAALGRVEVVVRGPKPHSVMREWGVRVDVAVPEPNTWADVLAALDARRDLRGVRVAVQEYGKPAADLVAGLRQRGAVVTTVPVYRWELPEDLGPLRRAARAIASGAVGAALFTSARQVDHLLQIAEEQGVGAELLAALRGRVVVGSIGPTTTEALLSHGLTPDVEPDHPKMGHLVAAVAARWRESGKAAAPGEEEAGAGRVEVVARREPDAATAAAAAPPDGMDRRLWESPFLKACRREKAPITPVWLMRQAGRYMAEYRAVRSKVGFLELCKDPELATEVTVTAAEVLGVDAAILFADILLILEPLGFDLEFAKGEGPVIHNPVREARDVDRVRPLESIEPLAYVTDAVRGIRAALKPDLPLIGFAGAPFTLACYAIEGGSSRHYETAKALIYRDPGAWDALMARLVDATALYLGAQAAAGAQALQLFDSWVGTLSPTDYARFVQPHMRRLINMLPAGVPVIHFGTDTATLLELQRDAGGDVIGLDWRVPLGATWDRLGPGVGVQGNLDPTVLLGPLPELRSQVRRILGEAAGRPGHIFNLGHGILPSTPVDSAKALVDLVHDPGA